MKLKTLTLENIRSYKEKTEIEFSNGNILFEGDIGSGKSTILYAIEFALFGLSDLKDIGMLRVGEKEGHISLNFEVDGKDYRVYRKLTKKGDSVVIGNCYLIENNTKLHLTTSELKERILQILNFNEKTNPNASSVIYRYAIFTPQEKMREILFQKRDDRIDTLRRAFGIEEYSITVKNADILRIAIEKEINLKKGQTENLDEDKEELAEKEKSLKENFSLKEKVDVKLKDVEEKISKVREEEDKLRKEKEFAISIQKDIENIRKKIVEKGEAKEDFIEKNKLLEERIKVKEKEIEEFSKIKIPTEESEEDLSKKIKEIEDKKELENKKLSEVEIFISKAEKEIEGIEREGNNKKELQKDLKDKNKKLLEEVKAKKENLDIFLAIKKPTEESEEDLERKIENLDNSLIEKEKKRSIAEDDLKKFSSIFKEERCPTCGAKIEPQKFAGKIEELKIKIGKLNDDIENLKKEKEILKKNLKDLRDFLIKKKDAEKLKEIIAEKEEEIEENNKKIEYFEKEVKELRERLLKRREEKELKNKEKERKEEEVEIVKREFLAMKKIQEELREYTKKKDRIEGAKNEVKNFKEQKEEHQKNLEKIEKEVSDLRRILEEKNSELEKYKDVELKIAKTKLKKDEIEKERDKIIKEISSFQQKIDDLKEEISNIKIKIKDKEEKKEKMFSLIDFRNYIQEFFIPTVNTIEKHVLSAINEEFNALFQKYFSMFIEEPDFTVKIDNDFTPIIEQGKYELGIEGLSGGEKTSLALSYRLALNVLVKKVCNAMKGNLLILDEPTDGFSKEQLFKFRDVLNALNCEQIIIVSHERELESFADKIYRVRKEGNISRIEG